MGVFGVFGYAQLLEPSVADDLAENVFDALRAEGELDVGHLLVVLRHADIGKVPELLSLEAVERGIDENGRYLPRPVGTEVKEDEAVAVAHRLRVRRDRRDDELVRHAFRVGLFESLDRARELFALKARHRGVRLFHAVPLLFAVHRVVPAHDGGYLADAQLVHLRLKLRGVALAGRYADVASVHNAVDVDLPDAEPLRHLEQTEHVGYMAVDAAVGQQARHVQRLAVVRGVPHRLAQRLVLEERAVLDRLGYLDQVLIYDPSGADIGVTDLGVAHLTVGQTDPQTGSLYLSVRVFRPKLVKTGLFRRLDRVAVLRRIDAEAVHYA